MHWPSEWSEGFPGWHLECSAMREKYLGRELDIHGGGMDLMFPHHECEIAQNVASRGIGGVHYWMHNNMITINGKKMGKSLGNFITLSELFSGNNDVLAQAYSPMTIRFFILQAHYRSTLDFSNEALQAAEKGLAKMLTAAKDLKSLQAKAAASENSEVQQIYEKCYEALCDDLNTPVALSHIFDAVRIINSVKAGQMQISSEDLALLVKLFDEVLGGILGIVDESAQGSKSATVLEGLMDIVLKERQEAKAARNWAKSDEIRDQLKALGITIKDGKEGTEWSL